MEITKEFKEKSKEALDHGTFCAFIPHRLEIADRPELNNFSLNILFSSWTVKNGIAVMGSALYEPNLTTFTDGPNQRMTYYNQNSRDCRVEVEYDTKKHIYSGRKYINGQSVGLACGPNWKMFFVHLTMLGLSSGERCEFKVIE